MRHMEYVGWNANNLFVFMDDNGDLAGFDRRHPQSDDHRVTNWYHPTGFGTHYGHTTQDPNVRHPCPYCGRRKRGWRAAESEMLCADCDRRKVAG